MTATFAAFLHLACLLPTTGTNLRRTPIARRQEHNEKGDNPTSNWHAERALEYSNHAYKLAKEAHTKSGQMVTL